MNTEEYERLYNEALKRLRKSPDETMPAFSSMSLKKLLEINSVYHAELEAQNEELHESLEKLERANSELNILFSKSPSPLMLLSKEMQVLRYNEEALHYFGAILKRNVPVYMHSFLAKHTIGAFLVWIESQTGYLEPFELEMVTETGPRWCQLKAFVWSEEKKTYLITVEDIHEHNEQLQGFKRLAESIPNVVLRLSMSGEILYANQHAFDFFKFTEETKANHICKLDFFQKTYDTGVCQRVDSLYELQEQEHFSLECDGRHYLLSIVPELEANWPVTYLMLIEDITVRMESEKMFQQVLYMASDAITLFDYQSGELVFFNKKAEALFGKDILHSGKVLNHTIFNVYHSEYSLSRHIKQLKEYGEDVFEASVTLPHDQERFLKVYCTLVTFGEKKYHQSTIHDVTDQKRYEEQLKQTSKVFEHTAEGIMITDTGGTVLSVNDAFSTITGYTKDEIIGKKTSILKSGKHNHAFYAQMWDDVAVKGLWRGEIWNKKKDGSLYPSLLTISTIYDNYQNPAQYVGIFSDISSFKENQLLLEELAHYDTLTKLPNRFLFKEELNVFIKSSKRQNNKVALLFIDLDHFKNINDTYGHSVGDAILIESANRLKHQSRDSDVVARLGGDEFIVALNDFEAIESLKRVAEKLNKTLSEPIEHQGRSHFITASIGISIFPDDANDIEEMLQHADIAMYAAKSSGKNRYRIFKHEMSDKAKWTNELYHDLKVAISDKQFYVVYQPQFDLRQEQIVGFEALIRWKHPAKGSILAADFIQSAEEAGMIIALGRFVLERVSQDIEVFQTYSSQTFSIAVNVSHVELDDSYIDYLDTLIKKNPAIKEILKIEVTETSAMKHIQQAIHIIGCLKERGLAISLDDFGTGHSSLSAIKTLGVDEIKIDQSFIIEVMKDEKDRELVSSIIAMAKAMNKVVLAEGVEDENTLKFLQTSGCDIVQGYYISKPLELQEVPKCLQSMLKT